MEEDDKKTFSKMEANKWDLRFLDMAYHVSTWSKDPSTKVGSVIVDGDNRVVSIGFNGFPKGLKDSKERLDDRETKYKLVVHSEINAILFANRSLKGCRLYIYPFMPCNNCAGPVIQSGIKKVIAPNNNDSRWNGDWKENFKLSQMMFDEADVEICLLENFTPDIQVNE